MLLAIALLLNSLSFAITDPAAVRTHHIDQPPSHLSKREIICNQPPNPALPVGDCLHAVSEIPHSYEGTDYHYADLGHRIVIDTVLTTGGDPNSPNHLPRVFAGPKCSVTVLLGEDDARPGEVAARLRAGHSRTRPDTRTKTGTEEVRMLWDNVKARAHNLVSHCVGGGTRFGPRDGYGGNLTVDGLTVLVGPVA
ncbi:hypothetical protein MMC16_004603 [Acarospora aff. strigata]|nr:hypothetical protein [Acarospora aff. strigata]